MDELKERYACMDKMPVQGWVWEFVRRNETFIDTIKDIKAIPKASFLLPQEFSLSIRDIEVTSDNKSVSEKLDVLQKKFLLSLPILNEDSKGYLQKKVKGFDFCIGIPNPDARYCDLSPEIRFRGGVPLTYYKFKEDDIEAYHKKDMETYRKSCQRVISRVTPLDIEDTVYIGISTSAKKEDIEKELKEVIKEHIKPKSQRLRPREWKYYLIAHDLHDFFVKKEKENIFDKITMLLSTAYPKDAKKFSLEAMEDYVQKASWLINNGYKDYLYQ